MAEISGRVEIHSDKRKGKMTIRVISDSGIEKDHHVPQDQDLDHRFQDQCLEMMKTLLIK